MSLPKQEQQNEVRMTERDTERLVFGWFARGFSRPRVQKLCDAFTGLDQLDACRLAAEIDEALGAAASNKILAKLSSPRAACQRAIPNKPKRQREGVNKL